MATEIARLEAEEKSEDEDEDEALEDERALKIQAQEGRFEQAEGGQRHSRKILEGCHH